MTIASGKMTFDEYLAYDDGTDTRYELVNGELIAMPPESRLNARIAMFLVLEFAKHVPFHLICCKDTEVEVSGRFASAWLPALMILTELRLVNGLYEEQMFQGNAKITSPMLPNLELTPEQLLNAGL